MVDKVSVYCYKMATMQNPDKEDFEVMVAADMPVEQTPERLNDVAAYNRALALYIATQYPELGISYQEMTERLAARHPDLDALFRRYPNLISGVLNETRTSFLDEPESDDDNDMCDGDPEADAFRFLMDISFLRTQALIYQALTDEDPVERFALGLLLLLKERAKSADGRVTFPSELGALIPQLELSSDVKGISVPLRRIPRVADLLHGTKAIEEEQRIHREKTRSALGDDDDLVPVHIADCGTMIDMDRGGDADASHRFTVDSSTEPERNYPEQVAEFLREFNSAEKLRILARKILNIHN